MKRTTSIYVAIGALFIVLLLFQLQVPQRFSWEPTFSHSDKQPFGCALFDSVLSASLPQGYSVSRKSFYQLSKQQGIEHKGIICIQNEKQLSSLEATSMLSIAKRGGTILVSSRVADSTFIKQLGMDLPSISYFNLRTVQEELNTSGHNTYDTIRWVSADYPARTYRMLQDFSDYDGIITYRNVKVLAKARRWWTNSNDDSNDDELVTDTVEVNDDNEDAQTESTPETTLDAKDSISSLDYVTAAEVSYGKGRVILISTPLLFTNYGMLKSNAESYICRLISRLGRRPIVRLEPDIAMNAIEESKQSPMRYILMQKPLRWAFRLALLGILVYMIMCARRRQRVIPLLRQPVNPTLEFIRLIGTLFYRRKDNSDLLWKAIDCFAGEMRARLFIYILDESKTDHAAKLLAAADTGNPSATAQFLANLQLERKQHHEVDDAMLKAYIDRMNHIKQQL